MTGKNKIVHFLSASDRINYGDLLFPLIFKKMLFKFDKNIEFKNYGIIRSNLTYFGALKTFSYLRLLKNIGKTGGNVVVGGGEVFFANWSVLFGFINPIYVFLKKNSFFKRLDKKFKIAEYLLVKNKVVIPFVPSLKELKHRDTRVFYNAVGGNFWGNRANKRNQIIENNLQEASYISVRDERTQRSLRGFNISSRLSPDSALIMSDLFPISYLANTIMDKKIKKLDNYIFLQIGINKAPSDLDIFMKSFLKEVKKSKLTVVLCPIGMAPNHEDHIILEKILSYSDELKMIIPKNLYEIMYLIANAKVYMGTSLHGLITAQSFNIPFIPLNKRINKMNSYCETWTLPVCTGCLDFEEIDKMTTILQNWDFEKIKVATQDQKELVYANFSNILNELI
jgi:polysaccharide pyruvyl transferase WcaK-like protein